MVVMDWEKYYEDIKKRLVVGRNYKRLLLLSWDQEPRQALLLNKEGEVYGVEEAFSLKGEPEGSPRGNLEGAALELKEEPERERLEALAMEESPESRSDKLLKQLKRWKLSEPFPVAICLEGLYQEEFPLPKLPDKELKGLIQEEAKLRLPFSENSYIYGYKVLKEKEEFTVQLVALEKSVLQELEAFVASFRGKLVWVGGTSFLEQEELASTEFWNCFCDKEKQRKLEEEYQELLRFGQGCFRHRGVVNLLQPAFWWEQVQGRRKAAAYVGLGIFGISLLLLPMLGLQQYRVNQERRGVENQLRELAPWKNKRDLLVKLQQQVKQKENLVKQLKLAPAQEARLVELLGRVMPASCWLTSLEEKDRLLVLKGKALNSNGVELLRKQLLVTGECQTCELLSCKSMPEEDEVSFILKLIL